ncbi:MAG TPA: sigma 54-interacting transcriptional regulator, partial [Syntrophomonas sp.]|nr:sigma 54-interacting transcriptional regulator [Syntrophomonas sp.]
MIQTVLFFINNFDYLINLPGCLLALLDRNQTILCITGDESKVSYFKDINATVGSVWREDTGGTTAHVLSMALRRPAQLIGPEHYCTALQYEIASAAPILDNEGEVIGVLVLIQPMTRPFENGFEKTGLHTMALGLITAMATAVETQMKLKMSNESLKIANHCLIEANDQLEAANLQLHTANHMLTRATNTLEVTLVSVDEGLITVDPDGSIVRINPEGCRILRKPSEELLQRNIMDFIRNQSGIEKTLVRGEAIHFQEETICCDKEELPVMLSIRPVFVEDNNEIDGAVIRLTPTDRINALANNRVGARARFKFDDIMGSSEKLEKSKLMAKRFAVSFENILLVGESGTGKELFAQAIHNEYRPNGPFIAINCAAMPRNLIESELFGYEGGSFTGAERHGRPGKIELAHGGTLFLDEIGDMPFELQAVLLRVLEDKQVMRIGGRRYQAVDFRMVAATNKDLRKMVEENQFREDLYYRLSVLKIPLPPLREREDDILLLAKFFIDRYCRRTGQVPPDISPAAGERMLAYDWPGNVRQLENAMIYAVNMANAGIIGLEQLPDDVFYIRQSDMKFENIPTATVREKAVAAKQGVVPMKDVEKIAIINALQSANNHVQNAADLLEISKSTMYRKLKEYN